MANDFYTPEELAGTALALVGPDLNVSKTISRSYEANFRGGVGYTVNIRKPVSLTARSRTLGAVTAITADAVAETVASVVLDTEVYSAVDLSDADLTLNLEDFGRQVLKPQTDAVVYDVEARVIAQMEAITPTIDLDLTAPLAAFSAARKSLRSNMVPMDSLFAVAGVDVYQKLLDLDLLKQANTAGTTDALREGQITHKVAGFTVIENNDIASDRVVFYHRDAFHLAVRAPIVPQGVSFGASASGNGFAMRTIRDYDPTTLQDRSVVSTFVGVDTLGILKRGSDTVYVPAIAADPDVTP